MLNLDMHTVFAVCSTLNLVLGLGMLLVHFTRIPYPGFRLFTLACLSLGAALTLFANPGLFPLPVITVVGNVCFVLYPVLYSRGLRLFAGRTVSTAAPVAAVLFTAGFAYYFTQHQLNMFWRVTWVSVVMVLFYADCIKVLYRNQAFAHQLTRTWLAAFFGVYIAWTFLRVGLMAQAGVDQHDIWTPSLQQVVSMLLITAVNIAITLGIILLNFQRAAAELERERERLALAVTATQDAVWEWNVQTDETYYSPRWYEMLGLEPGPGRATMADWRARCHPDDLGTVAGVTEAALRAPEERLLVTEFRLRHRDGSWRYIQSRGRIVRRDGAGRPLLMSGTNSDVTEQRRLHEQQEQLERQWQQSRKLEALGTLAGGIAHDFNNILVGILGNLQLAEMELPASSPVRSFLQRATQASQRARDLIARIMTFSRKAEVAPQRVDAGRIAGEVAQLLRASLPARIELATSIAPGCPPLRGNAAEVHELLMNLALNSAAAIGDRPGRITFSLEYGPPPAALVERHPQVGPEPQLMLAVADNGVGMTPEVQARMFEPFFTTKEPGQGTGIGLTMVHRIVTDLGGTIAVESTPGQGSVFRLFLPASPDARPAGEDPAPLAPSAVGGGRGRILLVDDEAVVRDVARLALRRLGYEVDEFSDPVAAAEAAVQRRGYAAVLTDLSMPQLSGLELAARIRAADLQMPILIMTGNRPSGGTAVSGVHFIDKPFELALLQEMLARLTGGQL
jgi:PAS domain S-box-containing protein